MELVFSSHSNWSFYIYDVPMLSIDAFPTYEAALQNLKDMETAKDKSGNIFKESFAFNEGFGKYNASTYLFDTWQYATFRNIYSRLVRSAKRTRNISEASMFFIPYDLGPEAWMDRQGNYQGAGNAMAPFMSNMLATSSQFKRNNGVDHFLVHSTSLMAQRMGSKMKHFYSICANCTVLAFEVMPYTFLDKDTHKFVQAVPQTSVYHWRDDVGNDSIPALNIHKNRSIFISYFGSSHTNMPPSNKFRVYLSHQCGAMNSNSTLKKRLHKYSEICKLGAITGNRNLPLLDEIITSYENSIFCLMPQGDTPTRRAIFDSLLAGCIPVILTELHGTITQYNWNFSPEEMKYAFVSLPVVLFGDHNYAGIGINYIDILSHISEEEITHRQLFVKQASFKAQYSMPSNATSRQIPSTSAVLDIWNPPRKDAVDLILENMYERVKIYAKY